MASTAGKPIASGSSTPLYQQIYLRIRHQIMTGEYPNSSLLPSEYETARSFGVSRITAKRALNELAADGLCVRNRGRRSRVTYKPSAGPLKLDTQGLMDFIADMNLEMAGRVLEFDILPASPRIAEIMEVSQGTPVQRSVRSRSVGGKPLSYLTTYVPAELGRHFNSEDLTNHAALTLLEQSGVEVSHAEQTITATLAEARTADSLEVKQGAPLLRISRVVYDKDGRVVEYIVGIYRPDQYQYQMSLSRVADGERHSWTSAKHSLDSNATTESMEG